MKAISRDLDTSSWACYNKAAEMSVGAFCCLAPVEQNHISDVSKALLLCGCTSVPNHLSNDWQTQEERFVMRRIPHDEFGRKRCSRCHEYKPITEFAKNKRKADGLNEKCRKCKSIAQDYETLRFRREQHKAGLRHCASCHEWKSLSEFYFIKSVNLYDSYCKQCSRMLADRFRKKTGYNHQYYVEHIEENKARTRRWREENPSKKLAAKQRRRARIHGNGGSFTAEEWAGLKEKWGYRCLCCGDREPDLTLEPDHVIPISKGGTNNIGNIQPLCHSCNAKKSDKTIDYRGDP